MHFLFADTVTVDPIVALATALALAVAYLAQLVIQIRQGQAATERGLAAAERDKAAAAEVSKVKLALSTANAQTNAKLDEVAATSALTHGLVNSAMANQLRLYALLARRLARATGEAADQEAAEQAEQAYAAQLARQARVDLHQSHDQPQTGEQRP